MRKPKPSRSVYRAVTCAVSLPYLAAILLAGEAQAGSDPDLATGSGLSASISIYTANQSAAVPINRIAEHSPRGYSGGATRNAGSVGYVGFSSPRLGDQLAQARPRPAPRGYPPPPRRGQRSSPKVQRLGNQRNKHRTDSLLDNFYGRVSGGLGLFTLRGSDDIGLYNSTGSRSRSASNISNIGDVSLKESHVDFRLAIGYRLYPSFSLELETGYLSPSYRETIDRRSVSRPIGVAFDANMTQIPLIINAIYQLYRGKSVGVYAGVGLGYTFATKLGGEIYRLVLDQEIRAATLEFKDGSESFPTAHLFAGASWLLSPERGVEAFAQYRLSGIEATNVHAKLDSITGTVPSVLCSDPDCTTNLAPPSTNTLEVGLRFNH